MYGPGRPAEEAEVVALLGKIVRTGDRPFGVNLNLGWTARLDPKPGDRPNRYLLIATAGQVVSRDTALVASYLRQQQERGERDFDLIQAGVRHRLPGGGGAVVGLAAGVGLTRDSPRFQISFAVQWAIGAGER